MNGNMAPKSIVVGVADLVPLGGRQNPRRRHWRAFWDASGVLTAGMQTKGCIVNKGGPFGSKVQTQVCKARQADKVREA